MPLRCIVFDCDGVLLDSVPVKTRAFARLAEPYGSEAQARLARYHMEHGGMSRYQKFAWFFREVLGREITEEESVSWGQRFAYFALDEVRRCAMISGAREMLDAWHARLPLYVCSGAPDGELRQILRERELDRYFAGIFGTPPEKAELLAAIVRRANAAPEETLMVGDSGTDREAAASVGTLFYGIGEALRGGLHPWGRDLTELSSFVAARF